MMPTLRNIPIYLNLFLINKEGSFSHNLFSIEMRAKEFKHFEERITICRLLNLLILYLEIESLSMTTLLRLARYAIRITHIKIVPSSIQILTY